MFSLFRISKLLIFLFLIVASSSLAATDDEIQNALDQKKLSDGSKTDSLQTSPGDVSPRTGGSLNLSGDDLKILLEKGRDAADDSSNLQMNETDRDKAKKPTINVKLEPADGLVKLTWKIANYQPNTATNGPTRFIVEYGNESGKLLKSIEVGTTDTYTIRELKNYQVYYVQVSAYSKKDKRGTLIKSEELSVIPLPSDQQGSLLEKSFSRKNLTLLDKVETEPLKRELRQFGYDFFKNSSPLQSSFENLPAGGKYILGPGDSLVITAWGGYSTRLDLTIDRNGEITIPKVGAISLSGMAFDQARDAVTKAISRYYKNFQVNVTLGKLRSIQVFVVGEVETPGGYSVSSLSTVINALSSAGGPSRNGSLRAIRLMREGVLVNEIDLYDMFLSGDRSKDLRLQNGDTIFVPVIGSVVAVAGEVKRPAIYEIKGKMSLADVIQMAGGITASGNTDRVQIERFAGNRSKIVLDYILKDGMPDHTTAGIEIMDRDMVKVFPVQEAERQIVSLKGNVVRPGEYQYRKGMRVKDLINSFSDLQPESYLESAEITRLALPDYHKEILTFNLRKAMNGSDADNIELQEQDTIKVFSHWEMQEKPTVAINGYVVNPGTYDFYPGMTLRDLVAAAGSPKHNAILDFAELTRVSIQGDMAHSSRQQIDLAKALTGDPQHNLPLQADDVLIVRGIADWAEATDKFVTLKGEVKFPGIYSITRGEKMSSVIARAGGYSDKAYLKGARFTRRSVRENQQKRMNEILARTEKDILQKQASITFVASSVEEIQGTKVALDSLMKGLDRLKELKAEGRVVIRLSQLDELKKSGYDLEMEGGDVLDIPPRPNVVNIMGLVYNPTTFVYVPDSSEVNTYLQKAGGPTLDAEPSDMYIIKVDGSVFSRQQSSFGLKWSDDAKKWSFGSFMSTYMDPGDTLVVPQKLEHTAWLRDIKDITTIISQIALTAGTVLVGLR